MKSLNQVGLLALAIAATSVSHAETYDGVHSLTSKSSRAEIRAQAFATARLPDAFSEAADSHVQAKVSSADRATVHADAVTKAHDPLQSLDRRAFYRDQIPAAYSKSRVSFRASASH
jgi:hypothetical protein